MNELKKIKDKLTDNNIKNRKEGRDRVVNKHYKSILSKFGIFVVDF